MGWGCENKEIDGYWILDSLFEPAALIKNASVIITDDNGNNYDFSYVENIAFVDTIYLTPQWLFMEQLLIGIPQFLIQTI